MADNPEAKTWTRPAAMAIPKGGVLGKAEQGRYGSIFQINGEAYLQCRGIFDTFSSVLDLMQ